ncbi:MAG: sodium:calcium antiporter, partial [Thermodesulfobacteriota bacterium]
MLSYILLILGFALLVKGADILVDGATSVARRFGVSDLVIGLTIVSIGSSAPELIVNVIASFRGSTDLAVGNVLGSNTANILLGLGVAAIIYNLKVQKSTVWREI